MVDSDTTVPLLWSHRRSSVRKDRRQERGGRSTILGSVGLLNSTYQGAVSRRHFDVRRDGVVILSKQERFPKVDRYPCLTSVFTSSVVGSVVLFR